MSDEKKRKCPPPGAPPWMATFADLMSLLMCFFVLLLSFSEMDVLKFKQLAGSMREAFGVQQQIKVKDIPKGTSIIAQEFSPGRPEPTPLNEVRQFTTESSKQNLDVRRQEGEAEHMDAEAGQLQELARKMIEDQAQAEAAAQEDALMMALALQQEIGEGAVDVEARDAKVIVRLREQGSFESGAAELNYDFIPIIAKIRDVLLNVQGSVSVEGHSDNIPIATDQFQSNWGLSSARALSVANELFDDERVNEERFQVVGYADTKPLAPNNTSANRALNRRVEIVIQKGKDEELLKRVPTVPEGMDGSEVEGVELAPSEIF